MAVRVFAPRPVWRWRAICGPWLCSTTLRPEPAHFPPSGTSPCPADGARPLPGDAPAARRKDVFFSVVATPELLIFRGLRQPMQTKFQVARSPFEYRYQKHLRLINSALLPITTRLSLGS